MVLFGFLSNLERNTFPHGTQRIVTPTGPSTTIFNRTKGDRIAIQLVGSYEFAVLQPPSYRNVAQIVIWWERRESPRKCLGTVESSVSADSVRLPHNSGSWVGFVTRLLKKIIIYCISVTFLLNNYFN